MGETDELCFCSLRFTITRSMKIAQSRDNNTDLPLGVSFSFIARKHGGRVHFPNLLLCFRKGFTWPLKLFFAKRHVNIRNSIGATNSGEKINGKKWTGMSIVGFLPSLTSKRADATCFLEFLGGHESHGVSGKDESHTKCRQEFGIFSLSEVRLGQSPSNGMICTLRRNCESIFFFLPTVDSA